MQNIILHIIVIFLEFNENNSSSTSTFYCIQVVLFLFINIKIEESLINNYQKCNNFYSSIIIIESHNFNLCMCCYTGCFL